MIRMASWLLLLAQVLYLCIFASNALRLDYDNRIDRFAVTQSQTERDFDLITRHFGQASFFIVVVQAKPGISLVQAEVVPLFDQIGALSQVVRFYARHKMVPPDWQSPSTSLLPFGDEEMGWHAGYFSLAEGSDGQAQLDQVRKLAHAWQSGQTKVQHIYFGGEPFVNKALDDGSREVQVRLFPLLAIIAFSLFFYLFRDWRVLLVSAVSVLSSMVGIAGLMAMWGLRLNLVTALIPPLTFVLAVAMHVHVLLGIASCGSVTRGVLIKLKPNFLVALTTSFGFGSLAWSEVAAVALLGKLMAASIWLVYFWVHVTHLGLSLLLQLRVGPRPFLNPQRLADRSAYVGCLKRPALLGLALAVIVSGGWSIYVNPSESNGLNYFPATHSIRQDTAWLQRHVTGTSQIDVVLKLPSRFAHWDDALEEEVTAQFEGQLATIKEVKQVLSQHQINQFAIALTESNPDRDVEEHEPLLEQFEAAGGNFVQQDFYRIQLLVDSMDEIQFAQVRTQLVSMLEAGGWQDSLISGVLVRILTIQAYLLETLAKGLGTAILLVILIMLFLPGVRGRAGLVLIPNLFPLGCMGLGLYLAQIPTTIASVMVFSIALGIAVDDTIHLIYGFSEQPGDHFWTRWRAVLARDGQAVVLTTVILSCGFLVLAGSRFLPTKHFGFLLGIGMIAALVGDLLFLPLLLKRSPGLSSEDSVCRNPKPQA